ncbi:FAD-dependent oxidoreductase [Oceanobacillus senegalensis]|uniref:FAD-dependent oxidoreductase n=1 Tax=Oceanobacillus senegalensis TaxID=1936063 RepID=UPI000A305203|nr:NAD(P)/FAD-dependent oxidoreductase [Oceanobacillus senegalensis]
MRFKDKQKSELRVAIIGAGIGGAAAAVALHRKGIKADLYEQATAIKEVGAGIGMRPPTLDFFKKWGIYDEIVQKSSVSNYMDVATAHGEVLVKEAWPVLTDNPEETWARLIHRADLIDILLNHVPPQNVHLEHRCKSITEHDDYAEVYFENGKKVEADLVIAADGIRSTIRRQFFSDAEPIYSGMHAYRTILKEKDAYFVVNDIFRVFVAESGAHIYLMPLHHRNQVSYDITVRSDDASWHPEVSREDILQHLKEFDPKFREMAMIAEDFTCRAVFDIDPINCWTSNCIGLLGDAAHAMLHHRGQGANMAIQDAGVLAESIEETDTIQDALKIYESRRKPMTRHYQELSRQSPNVKAETAFPEKEALGI